MFLAPFSGDTINEPRVVTGIDRLLDLLASSLRRLVVDIEFRSHYPDEPDSREIRVPLRNAFSKLANLEEFVSVRDELYLSATTTTGSDYRVEPPIWSMWPRLQKLALYNIDINEDFRKHLSQLHDLKTLVLTRADGLDELDELIATLPPSAKAIVVNVWINHEPEHRESLRHTSTLLSWGRGRTSEPQGQTNGAGATVQVVCVDDINLYAASDAPEIRACQSLVKDTALDGSLWQ